MAKTKQKRTSTNQKLDKTLQINDITYDIYATHSDTAYSATEAATAAVAQQLQQKLTLTKKTINNPDDSVTFDGSSATSIDIVPAEGGRFSGRITVPDNLAATLTSDGETVVNYNDVVSKILDQIKNNSTVYAWDGSTLKGISLTTAAINGISLVTGRDDARTSFVDYNNNENKISNYLYLSTAGADHGYLYYGTAGSKDNLRLSAGNARLLVATEEAKETRPDLTSYSAGRLYDLFKAINDRFNEFIDSNGNVIADRLVTTDGSVSGQDLIDYINEILTNINKIISGDITIKNATNAENAVRASTVTVHTSAGNGASPVTTYPRSRIIISTAVPTVNDGINGDIWITY